MKDRHTDITKRHTNINVGNTMTSIYDRHIDMNVRQALTSMYDRHTDFNVRLCHEYKTDTDIHVG